MSKQIDNEQAVQNELAAAHHERVCTPVGSEVAVLRAQLERARADVDLARSDASHWRERSMEVEANAFKVLDERDNLRHTSEVSRARHLASLPEPPAAPPQPDPVCAVCEEPIGMRPATQGYIDGQWRHDVCAEREGYVDRKRAAAPPHGGTDADRTLHGRLAEQAEVLRYYFDREGMQPLYGAGREHEAREVCAGGDDEDMAAIEWTDKTVNVQIGCSRKSPGCEHCYAETQASAMARRFGKPGQAGHRYLPVVDGKGRWSRSIVLDDAALARPPHGAPPRGHGIPWRKTTVVGLVREVRHPRVFLGSMTDHFHEDVTPEMFLRVVQWMSQAPTVIWQVVTKRPERAPELLRAATEWWVLEGQKDQRPFPTIHLLATVEDQPRADERVPALLESAPYVDLVGLSVEPLLGPVVIPQVDRLGWVIVGGESGRGARPCDVEWIRGILKQCRDAKVPAFCKQLGGNPWEGPVAHQLTVEPSRDMGGGAWTVPRRAPILDPKGGNPEEWPEDLRVRQWPA